MEGCDAGGGPSDGHIWQNIRSYDEAQSIVVSESNTDIAYFWCSQSNRLIEKNPNKRTGHWKSQTGWMFLWGNEII